MTAHENRRLLRGSSMNSFFRRPFLSAFLVLSATLALQRVALARTPAFEPVVYSPPAAYRAEFSAGRPPLVRSPSADAWPYVDGRFEGLEADDGRAVVLTTERGPAIMCRISRHPLDGLRPAQHACPLLFADTADPGAAGGGAWKTSSDRTPTSTSGAPRATAGTISPRKLS